MNAFGQVGVLVQCVHLIGRDGVFSCGEEVALNLATTFTYLTFSDGKTHMVCVEFCHRKLRDPSANIIPNRLIENI